MKKSSNDETKEKERYLSMRDSEEYHEKFQDKRNTKLNNEAI